jgi:hypothetical protein
MDIDKPQDVGGIARLDEAEAGPSAAPKRVRGDPTVDGKAAPWVEKYRPKTLDDVAAHKEIIDTSERGRRALGARAPSARAAGAARPQRARAATRPTPPARPAAAQPPPPPRRPAQSGG